MKVYAAIGTKGFEDIILGMFRSESDAEDFANDFDKTHCDVSEDDLFYSDEDFDEFEDDEEIPDEEYALPNHSLMDDLRLRNNF